jgi:hypothetical protein
MNYITDYQLDIDKGFMCKVNGIAYQFDFKYSTRKYLYYVSNILKLADFLEIDRSELKGIFNNETAYDVIYCDSKQECYDLCQHIVKTYFRPKQMESDKKEWLEKSRRYLAKYYAADESFVILNNLKWNLIWDQSRNVWWYHNSTHGVSEFFTQFGLETAKEVINLCSRLGISAKYINKVEFDSRQDAIKFTDYLIETYIIKKEKTYDTNQLRKERTAISRGAKPTGSIIHGRRGKASIRRGCIKHQTCIGY